MKIPEQFFGYSFIYYGTEGKFIPSRQLTYNRKQKISRLEHMSRLKSCAKYKSLIWNINILLENDQ